MPILDDIMDHEVLGPIKRLGLEMGARKGVRKGSFKERERFSPGRLRNGLARFPSGRTLVCRL